VGAKVYLPVRYKKARELTRRVEIVQKLKDLGVLVAGFEVKDSYGRWLIDTSFLHDVLQKEEYLKAHPEATPDVPEATGEQRAMAQAFLREYQAWRNRKEAGEVKVFT
jgi:hypothetical protein